MGEAAALTRKAVELALVGDPAALRLCLDRTVAPRTSGRACSAADPQRRRHPGCDKSVSGAVGRGAIPPGEAFTLSQMIETFLRAIDASDFEGRLRELEEDQAARRETIQVRRGLSAGAKRIRTLGPTLGIIVSR
jgi:hypothetical protein